MCICGVGIAWWPPWPLLRKNTNDAKAPIGERGREAERARKEGKYEIFLIDWGKKTSATTSYYTYMCMQCDINILIPLLELPCCRHSAIRPSLYIIYIFICARCYHFCSAQTLDTAIWCRWRRHTEKWNWKRTSFVRPQFIPSAAHDAAESSTKRFFSHTLIFDSRVDCPTSSSCLHIPKMVIQHVSANNLNEL